MSSATVVVAVYRGDTRASPRTRPGFERLGQTDRASRLTVRKNVRDILICMNCNKCSVTNISTYGISWPMGNEIAVKNRLGSRATTVAYLSILVRE